MTDPTARIHPSDAVSASPRSLLLDWRPQTGSVLPVLCAIEFFARYQGSATSDIHRRVGSEIPERTFRRALNELVTRGQSLRKGKGAGGAITRLSATEEKMADRIFGNSLKVPNFATQFYRPGRVCADTPRARTGRRQ